MTGQVTKLLQGLRLSGEMVCKTFHSLAEFQLKLLWKKGIMHNFEGIFRKTRIELGMALSPLSRIKICLVRRFLFYTFLNPSTFEFLLTVRLILDGVESSLVGVVSLAVDCLNAASDGSPQVWSLFH